MANNRFRAVEEAVARPAIFTEPPAPETSQYFGCKVFNRKQMRKYLSAETREKIYESIEQGVVLEADVAEQVAAGMKRWAMDMGATHYSHWFQPLTGGTAEKHDSFAEPHGKGDVLERFSGKLLAQQEPDASSFPNGGLRNTFEARGYTAWDPSSPSFIIGDTLCIPTVFISYTGEALDYKAPLLKSTYAVTRAASEILEYFGMGKELLKSYLGWEQEYFLVDTALYAQRPDLVLAERTLMGHSSARNQQLEDHYFGSIPLRALEFMRDLEFEAYSLGIPLKTRHNEVAPNQFELAPVYEEANLANDHNLLIMSLMKIVGDRHGFKVLFHEKPYKGVNGSGKHCNWSLGTDAVGLLSPGKTDTENIRFLAFMANVLKAVYDNNALLKATVASASNAHRLGANEAPPAIISCFLGSQMTQAFEELLESEDMVKIGSKSGYRLSIPQIPELLIDNTDRNRTSPFAFTGNRFEFRAVGSSANCALAVTAINTVVAHQLKKFKAAVEERISAGAPPMKAILDETRETYRSCKDVCFDGNGYSDEWLIEAEKRGLDTEDSVPKMYDACTSEKTMEIYKSTGVMTDVEMIARNDVRWDLYSKKIEIEEKILSDLSFNHILPIAIKYQSILLENISGMKNVFGDIKASELAGPQILAVEEMSGHICAIRRKVADMDRTTDEIFKIEDEREKALALHDKIVPFLDDIREHIDALEMEVDDQMWPLPKYRELLFIR